MTEDETIDASTPVTGQSRMDAAWGSESSEQASVAQPVAQTGQVFEQVYVPWEGSLNPRWMRNWAIFRHHVLGIVRKGHRPWGVPTKLVLIFVLIASMTDVALTLLFAVIGEPSLYELWGVGRNNLYGHILGFFLETCCIIHLLQLCLSEVSFRKIVPTEPALCISPALSIASIMLE